MTLLILMFVLLLAAVLIAAFVGAMILSDENGLLTVRRKVALVAVILVPSFIPGFLIGSKMEDLGNRDRVVETARTVASLQSDVYQESEHFQTNLFDLQEQSDELAELTSEEGIRVGLEPNGEITVTGSDEKVVFRMKDGTITDVDCSNFTGECPFD